MNTLSTFQRERLSFTSVLLLARHEDHAAVDRQSLRRMGLRAIRIMTSGVEAVRVLSGKQQLADDLPFPDLVLCDEQLSDMSGQEFLALLRSHPRLATFPVIMSLVHDTPAIRRELGELASSGVLVRPYSGDAFLNQLARAAAMHPPKKNPSHWFADAAQTGAFELALSRFTLSRRVSDQAAGQWFRQGLLAMRQEQWEDASVAFQQALKEQAGHADAMKGLTLALRKRQEQADADVEGRKRRLSREEADVLRDRLARAAASPNPEEAIQQVVVAALDGDEPLLPVTRPGQAIGQAVGQAIGQTPGGVPGAPRPERVTAGGPATSTPAHVPHTGNGASSAPNVLAPLPELPEPDGSGVLGRFPLLRDAVNVARVTLGLYKTHKK